MANDPKPYRNFIPSQGWMGASRFLGAIYRLKGQSGINAVEDAIWAYTVALIDHLGKSVGDPKVLRMMPAERRYDAWKEMATTLRKCLADQIRLLHIVEGHPVKFDDGAAVLRYGRKLLESVHAAGRTPSSGLDMDTIAGLAPDMKSAEWAGMVHAASAILQYDRSHHGITSGNCK